MILVKSDIAKTVENLPAAVGRVGVYHVYNDNAADNVAGVPHKQVDDAIKFPLTAASSAQDFASVDFAGQMLPEKFPVIAGPCSAENEEQVFETARFLKGLSISFFRAGCYKPRTNAYSFQGLGKSGLKLCRNACDTYDMKFVTEVKDLSNLDAVMDYADVVQVGSKCMYDVGVLKALGQQKKTVLLKRHFGATLKEFAQAADFIMCEGNENVVFCERGIRSFEPDTRFTLDSCGIEWLKEKTRLPVIGDPSHAMGYAYGVAGLSLSMIAQNVSGLIIEVHPTPATAKSDISQQLNYEEFASLHPKILALRAFMTDLLND